MIHGETRIVLRNPISGNILKDITSENTFQPTALQNFTHCLGEDLHGIPSYNWEDLVGGIFLFRDSITPGSLYMPASNVMIGNCAYGIANADLPNELGTYNSQESSASASAITQVYDFATNQANGQIGCVCLTSKVGGQIGYGNASGRRTDINFTQGQTGSVIVGGNATLVNNIEYSFTLTGDTLSVKKTNKSITQGTVFKGFYTTVDIDLSSIKPSGVTLNPSVSVFALNNNKIRIYSPITASIADGTDVYFFDYDPSDDSVVLGRFANSAGKAVRGDIVAVTFTPDNYFITYDGNRYLQVFNITNSTHVLDYTAEPLMNYNRAGNYDMPLSDGLLLDYASNTGYIVNYISGTVKPINVANITNYQAFNKRFPSLDAIGFSGSYSPPILKNPLYLATINNLNSPVTKTAAQTMKVTYTLTEA